jgi:hypothetical protein
VPSCLLVSPVGNEPWKDCLNILPFLVVPTMSRDFHCDDIEMEGGTGPSIFRWEAASGLGKLINFTIVDEVTRVSDHAADRTYLLRVPNQSQPPKGSTILLRHPLDTMFSIPPYDARYRH